MRHKLSFLLLYGTLVFFGGLGILLLIFGSKEPRPSLSENRMLAGFPALSADSARNGSFMSGLESYLSDNMFERDEIVSQASRIMGLLSLEPSTAEDIQAELFEQAAAFAQESAGEPPIATSIPQSALDAPTAALANPAAVASPTPSAFDDLSRKKDLSQVPACHFVCTLPSGETRPIYAYSAENVRRMIRVLNAYRAVLPEDGHMFFAQPSFPGVARALQSGVYIGWSSDLEDTINTFADDGVYALNVLEVLEQPLLDQEFIYFNNDHHWTPRGACYAANAFLRTMGIQPRSYDDYSFITYRDFFGSGFSDHPDQRTTGIPDILEVLVPDLPVKGYVMNWDKSRREAPLIYADRHNYTAYLGGTQGPWRQLETGVDCGRSCLVIGDSYDCDFIPFLVPYYETIHATDVRDYYYNYLRAQWSIGDYIAEYGIDDVYFVFSVTSGVNTDYIVDSLRALL